VKFLNRFLWVFVSPSKLFADVGQGRAAWWEGWIWVSLTGIVAAYFMLPISAVLIELNESGLPIDQVDAQLDFIDKWGVPLLATTPVVALIQALIVFGLGYVVVSILSPAANFKKYFTIGLFASIIANCAPLLTVLIVRMNGLDSIMETADVGNAQVSLVFLYTGEAAAAIALFQSLEFFTIWALVVVAIGLMRVFEMTRNQAVICVIPLWLLMFLQKLIAALFGGLG
jgi:hypothetical protein